MVPRASWAVMVGLVAGGLVCSLGASSPQAQRTAPPTSGGEDKTTVTLCDNETKTEIPTDMARTRGNGVVVAQALMSQ
jgi:hypothetical protein